MRDPLARWAASIALAAAVTLGALGTIDRAGEAQTEAGLTRALVAFGISRALNGVISAAQGTEIALSPAGIGVTLAPGQILDPVNDLVERFSWVMLAASTSLGVQRLFVEVGSSVAMNVAFALIAIGWLTVQWLPGERPPGVRAWAARALVLMLALRFAAPVFALASEGFYSAFLADRYAAATRDLETGRADIEKASAHAIPRAAANEGEASSLWDRTKRAYDSAASALDVEQRIERFAEIASKATTDVIDLIVVFVVQTALLPLLFAWIAIALVRRALASIRSG